MSDLDQFRALLPRIDGAALPKADAMKLLEILRVWFDAADRRAAEEQS